jgi:large repetitive protein
VLQSGLPDLPVSRLYFDPRDASHNTIYAATHVGIYRTTNGGGSWSPFGNGLPTVRVHDIYMPPDGSTIRIATYGRGIWELAQIELKNAVLADNTVSCDHDGVLDNAETGTLKITLVNQGPNNVNKGTLTFTSDNPHVTFPNGNKINVPPMNKGAAGSASIAVALAGAVGIENVTFSVAINAPELALSTPYSVTTSYRVNYDEAANASATETFEESTPAWTIVGDPTIVPNVYSWQRRALTFNDHVAYGPDNNGQEDDTKGSLPDEQTLVSPVLSVGAGSLGISFRHRFNFENGGWDGGVIELSNDNGVSWVDIGTGKYNGTTNAATDSPLGINHPAFVNRMSIPVLWPAFTNVTLNPVAGYSNQNVLVRFRTGADSSTGAPGWDIDDIAVTGLTNTPFTALVPNAGVCTP